MVGLVRFLIQENHFQCGEQTYVLLRSKTRQSGAEEVENVRIWYSMSGKVCVYNARLGYISDPGELV